MLSTVLHSIALLMALAAYKIFEFIASLEPEVVTETYTHSKRFDNITIVRVNGFNALQLCVCSGTLFTPIKSMHIEK